MWYAGGINVMKATGDRKRRIDDLGRVVIPKEIRRTLRLREGTPLEIFTDRGGDHFKEIFPMGGASCVCRAVCRSHVPGDWADRVTSQTGTR